MHIKKKKRINKIKSYSLLAEARPDQAHRPFLCRGWAQNIDGCWRDVVSPGSSPSVSDDFDLLAPCFLAIFPLIYFTAVLTMALMCQVLKHLALFSSH